MEVFLMVPDTLLLLLLLCKLLAPPTFEKHIWVNVYLKACSAQQTTMTKAE